MSLYHQVYTLHCYAKVAYVFCIGWNSKINNGFLSIYKLYFDPKNGPEVLLSLNIQKNFSWMLCYRKIHVNQASCGIFKKCHLRLMQVGSISFRDMPVYLLIRVP